MKIITRAFKIKLAALVFPGALGLVSCIHAEKNPMVTVPPVYSDTLATAAPGDTIS